MNCSHRQRVRDGEAKGGRRMVGYLCCVFLFLDILSNRVRHRDRQTERGG